MLRYLGLKGPPEPCARSLNFSLLAKDLRSGPDGEELFSR